MTKYSDEDDIIRGCCRFDEASQYKLYNTFAPSMFRICLRYSSGYHEAKEILNAAFLKIFLKINTFKNTGTIKGWMTRIMVTTAINHNRTKKKMKCAYFGDIIDNSRIIIAPEIVESLSCKEILNLVQELPETKRIIFNLFSIDGYSHKEIADLLDIPENTSKWHLMTARELLKKKIEKNITKAQLL